ncbi:MAG: hypothetical protein NG747_13350 [Candidatus Brocadia sp.]|nr:hypothetical protein [Candidatus Brocadia sp.]
MIETINHSSRDARLCVSTMFCLLAGFAGIFINTTVFANEIVRGKQQGAYLLDALSAPAVLTGTTTETIIWTTTVPANSLGLNGQLEARVIGTCTTGSLIRDMKLNYGGQLVALSNMVSSVLCFSYTQSFRNYGSVKAQKGMQLRYTSDYGATSSSAGNYPLTGSVDTTVDQPLSIVIKLGSGTETVSLESVVVRIYPSYP